MRGLVNLNILRSDMRMLKEGQQSRTVYNLKSNIKSNDLSYLSREKLTSFNPPVVEKDKKIVFQERVIKLKEFFKNQKS